MSLSCPTKLGFIAAILAFSSLWTGSCSAQTDTNRTDDGNLEWKEIYSQAQTSPTLGFIPADLQLPDSGPIALKMDEAVTGKIKTAKRLKLGLRGNLREVQEYRLSLTFIDRSRVEVRVLNTAEGAKASYEVKLFFDPEFQLAPAPLCSVKAKQVTGELMLELRYGRLELWANQESVFKCYTGASTKLAESWKLEVVEGNGTIDSVRQATLTGTEATQQLVDRMQGFDDEFGYYFEIEELDKAATIAEQRIEFARSSYGVDSEEYLQSRSDQARVAYRQGRIAEASAIYGEIRENLIAFYNLDHPFSSNLLTNEAVLLDSIGETAAALDILRKTKKDLESLHSLELMEHPLFLGVKLNYANCLANLAPVLAKLEEYSEAIELTKQVLANHQESLKLDLSPFPEQARELLLQKFRSNCLEDCVDLVKYHLKKRDSTGAQDYLAMGKKFLSAMPETKRLRSDLKMRMLEADLALQNNSPEKTKSTLKEVIKTSTEKLGELSAIALEGRTKLMEFYRLTNAKQDFISEAKSLYLLSQRNLPVIHPVRTKAEAEHARIIWMQAKQSQANLDKRKAEIQEIYVGLLKNGIEQFEGVASSLPVSQQLGSQVLFRDQMSQLISLQCPKIGTLVSGETTYALSLKVKSAIFERLQQQTLLGNSKSGAALLKNARKIGARLTGLLQKEKFDETWMKEWSETVTAQKEIELQISQQSLGALSRTETSVDAISNALQPGTVFVDYFAFEKWEGKELKWTKKSHLAAFSTTETGDVRLVDLGPSQGINDLFVAWQKNGFDKENGKKLRQKILDPVLSGEAFPKKLLICPDGVLNRIPFVALTAEDNKYLLEQKDLTIGYISSAQNLVAKKETPRSLGKGKFVCVTDLNYGQRSGAGFNKLSSSMTGGSLKSAKDFYNDQLVMITGDNASEVVVKEGMQKAEVVCFDTHGFFRTVTPKFAFTSEEVRTSDPTLYQVGLALSNANQFFNSQGFNIGSEMDGMLMQEELFGLPMSCKLVFISACNSGLGEQFNNEGITGIPRVLCANGVESVAYTLWPIELNSSQALVKRFMENVYQSGMEFDEAMKAAQLWMLEHADEIDVSDTLQEIEDGSDAIGMPEKVVERGQLSPFYWAAFSIIEK